MRGISAGVCMLAEGADACRRLQVYAVGAARSQMLSEEAEDALVLVVGDVDADASCKLGQDARLQESSSCGNLRREARARSQSLLVASQ